MCSLIRIVPVLLFMPVLTASLIEAAPAQPGAPGAPTTVVAQPDDGWSLDDVKDVFEAIQFVAITIGIGAAVYWLFIQHIPRMRVANLQLDVDVLCVGGTESEWLVEVVAVVHNLGPARAELSDNRFSLSSVAPGSGTNRARPLLQSQELTVLFDGNWSTSRIVVDAGTRTRFVCAAAIPKAVTHVLVTGQVTNPGRGSAYTASHLVELKRPASE